MRTKRALYDKNGKKTPEYHFWLEALTLLDNADKDLDNANKDYEGRKEKFQSLAKANKKNGRIDDWSTIFNERDKLHYTSAIKHIGKKLKEQKQNNKISGNF